MPEPIRATESDFEAILRLHLTEDAFAFLEMVSTRLVERMTVLVTERIVGQQLDPTTIAARMLTCAHDAWREHAAASADSGNDWHESDIAMDLALRMHLTQEQYEFVSNTAMSATKEFRTSAVVELSQLSDTPTGRQFAEIMYATAEAVHRKISS